MTGIIDYGAGNLFSLESSLKSLDIPSRVSSDINFLSSCDRLILPGVGAFGDAVKRLKEQNLFYKVKELAKEGMPLLGICLGMQLLFDSSEEYGLNEGLSLIRGKVKKIKTNLKIPHIGWNSLDITAPDCAVLKYVKQGDYVYFVHSFAAADCDGVAATCSYGGTVTAAVYSGNVYGAQFHPEKSGKVGLKILKAFGELK